MTDKQIIIDGVDVSGCEFLITNTNKQMCRCIKSDLFGGIEFVENAKNGNCKDNPNCYYKQLDQLKAENETLFKAIEEVNKINKRLEAENEKLKEELSTIQHNCNREGCKYYDDNTFKVFYECKAQKALQLSANSVTTKYCDLLQTLAEIKPILEFYANSKMGEEQPDRTYKIMLSGGYIMVYDPKPAREALRKINEVEDEI